MQQSVCEASPYIIRLETPDFINEIIKPHEKVLRYMGALEGIYGIIALLDREGGCPSVVEVGKRGGGSEDEYPKLRDILMRVTLRSHSYRVARLSMEALRTSYGNKFENHLPTVFLQA